VRQLRALMQTESTLEAVIAQLVTTIDPGGTARDIADIVGQKA
jgi:hypothetical protein